VRVEAPLKKVWEAIEDLTLIPAYHPEVARVEFLSNVDRRAPGVRYRCIIPSGRRRGWCIEEVVDHVPFERTSVRFPDDSWGLSKLVEDFRTEIAVLAESKSRTELRLTAFYRPKGWVRLANRIGMRRVMRHRARATLVGLRALVEGAAASPEPETIAGIPRP
jgi:hypothetical protein